MLQVSLLERDRVAAVSLQQITRYLPNFSLFLI